MSEDVDQYYWINRETYPRDFKPVYARFGLTPRLLTQFPILLPFHLPFRSGTSATFKIDDSAACTLVFSAVSSNHNFTAGIVGGEATSVPIHRSRVEMAHVTASASVLETTDEALSGRFDLLLGKLNAVIIAYLLHTKDFTVFPISREVLELASLVRTIPVDSWSEAQQTLFIHHLAAPVKHEDLPPDQLEEVLWYAHVVENALNPFTLPAQLLLFARRYWAGGQYRESVIAAQSGVETFLSTLFSKLLEAEGRTIAEVEQAIEEMPFIARIRREYHPRIGGQWQPESFGTAVGTWYQQTYLLRNRIVHAGYLPSYEEAQAAYVAATDLIDYVVILLRKRKRKYPQIWELVTRPDER
jgi:hypothetical protein